jgi:hypothetical protein
VSSVRRLRDELQKLQDSSSYIGEVVKVMGKNRVLVKVQPDGKYVVGVSAKIAMSSLTPNTRVALRSDSYVLHKILPSKVDPLVSLMRVEAVPDANYDMVGGLDKQVKEMKEVIEVRTASHTRMHLSSSRRALLLTHLSRTYLACVHSFVPTLSFRSSILSCSKVSVSRNRRVSLCMDHRSVD